MKEQGKSCIPLVTLLIVLVIFVQTNVLMLMVFGLKGNVTKSVTTEEKQIKTRAKETTWMLKIPKLELSADIVEGTSEEIINDSIGHFSHTPYDKGNIGLVAGCDGYKNNYFKDLEQLQQGDVILYQYGDVKSQYKVVINQIIDETDWSYLGAEQGEKITLITGVMNEPNKRRCVQAERIS